MAFIWAVFDVLSGAELGSSVMADEATIPLFSFN